MPTVALSRPCLAMGQSPSDRSCLMLSVAQILLEQRGARRAWGVRGANERPVEHGAGGMERQMVMVVLPNRGRLPVRETRAVQCDIIHTPFCASFHAPACFHAPSFSH